MYGKVKNIWDIKANGGGSSIDTENFAKKNEANTFTQKNTFENNGVITTFKTTDNESFGIEFKNSSNTSITYVGATADNKAFLYSPNQLKIEATNNNIDLNPGSGDVFVNTRKNWNQLADNSVIKFKDIKWERALQWESNVIQPSTAWNRNDWKWTLTNINSNSGFYEILFTISYQDDVAATFSGEVCWKNGLVESRSQIMSIEKNDRTFLFQFAIKNDGKLYCYVKHDNAGTGATIKWVRGWIKRGTQYPSKANTMW